MDIFLPGVGSSWRRGTKRDPLKVGPRVEAPLMGSKHSIGVRSSVEFGGVNVRRIRADIK